MKRKSGQLTRTELEKWAVKTHINDEPASGPSGLRPSEDDVEIMAKAKGPRRGKRLRPLPR